MNQGKSRPKKVTNVGHRSKLVLLGGINEKGFTVFPDEPPPPEFVLWAAANYARLRALLDKPVVLAVHWDEGDAAAIVQIVPVAEGTPTDEPFAEVELLFPTGGVQSGAPLN